MDEKLPFRNIVIACSFCWQLLDASVVEFQTLKHLTALLPGFHLGFFVWGEEFLGILDHTHFCRYFVLACY